MRTDWFRKKISSLYSFVICQIFIGLFKKMVTKLKKNLRTGSSPKDRHKYEKFIFFKLFLCKRKEVRDLNSG